MTPACDSVRRARPLLGTFVEISASGTYPGDLHAAVSRAFDIVADVHRLMSFHDRDSDVSRLNREAATRPVAVHPWTYEVLERLAFGLETLSHDVCCHFLPVILSAVGKHGNIEQVAHAIRHIVLSP